MDKLDAEKMLCFIEKYEAISRNNLALNIRNAMKKIQQHINCRNIGWRNFAAQKEILYMLGWDRVGRLKHR